MQSIHKTEDGEGLYFYRINIFLNQGGCFMQSSVLQASAMQTVYLFRAKDPGSALTHFIGFMILRFIKQEIIQIVIKRLKKSAT